MILFELYRKRHQRVIDELDTVHGTCIQMPSIDSTNTGERWRKTKRICRHHRRRRRRLRYTTEETSSSSSHGRCRQLNIKRWKITKKSKRKKRERKRRENRKMRPPAERNIQSNQLTISHEGGLTSSPNIYDIYPLSWLSMSY